MNYVKHIVAIDLGTTKIVGIVGEKTENGQYRILSYNETKSVGIDHGQIENIESVTGAVIPVLEKIKAEAHIDTARTYIYIGIAGQHMVCVEVRTERPRDRYETEISEEEIKKLESDACKMDLKSEEEILHVIPQKYSIDDGIDDIISPVGRLGNKLTGYFYVITGNRKNRMHAEIFMKRLNLSIAKLILEPVASAEATLDEAEKEVGVVMIDMGGGTTDIIVFKEKTVRLVAVIPFGGNSITEDIKKGCGILFDQAEKAKIQCGLSTLDSKDMLKVPGINGRAPRNICMGAISNIISCRLKEIMDMVMEKIKEAKCADMCTVGIVITGGVSKMKGMKKFLEAHTKMEVKLGTPDHIVNDRSDRIFQPEYSTAVGLVICGFEHAKTLPPLLPPPPVDPDSSGNQIIPPPPSPLIIVWLKKLWNIFMKFVNPETEEKND